MGLDIYKIKPTHEKTDFYIENEKEYPNRYREQLFVDFKDFIIKEQKDFIDLEKTLSKKSPELNHNDYTLIEIKEDENEYIFQRNDNSSELVSVKESELVIEKRDVEVIYFKTVEYQRKDMSKDFYNKFISSCWYVKNESGLSEYESNDIVISAEKFKELQSYAVKGAAINDWSFVEGQDAIYLSY